MYVCVLRAGMLLRIHTPKFMFFNVIFQANYACNICVSFACAFVIAVYIILFRFSSTMLISINIVYMLCIVLSLL